VKVVNDVSIYQVLVYFMYYSILLLYFMPEILKGGGIYSPEFLWGYKQVRNSLGGGIDKNRTVRKEIGHDFYLY
jgi:hypothetical protein